MSNNQPGNEPNNVANNQNLNRASPRSRQNDSYQQRACPSKVIKCSTRMRQREFACSWSVEDISVHLDLHQPGEFMLAPKFGDEDYEFAMKLFPNGKDEEYTGYLSLFLLIEKCPNPRLRFRVAFTLETADGPRNRLLNKNVVNIKRGGIVTASKFFSLEMLKSANNIYTPKDILTIGCKLTVFDEAQNYTSIMYHNPYNRFGKGISKYMSRESRSLQDLQQLVIEADPDGVPLLLHDDDLADFTIVSAEGREFRTHKAVLSARSEYFNALFRNKTAKEFMENRVHFNDISSDVLEVVTRHLYRSSISGVKNGVKDHELSHELVMAVERLMIDSLRLEIAQLLEENLTVENVVSRLVLVTELRLPSKYSSILEFFRNSQKECMKTEAWINLRAEKPALAIKFLEEAMQSYEEIETGEGKQSDPIIID